MRTHRHLWSMVVGLVLLLMSIKDAVAERRVIVAFGSGTVALPSNVVTLPSGSFLCRPTNLFLYQPAPTFIQPILVCQPVTVVPWWGTFGTLGAPGTFGGFGDIVRPPLFIVPSDSFWRYYTTPVIVGQVGPIITFTPPVLLPFRLRHRSAEDLQKLLNESQILPGVRFIGQGKTLMASGPSSILTGVGQARLRELIAALDVPEGKTGQPAAAALIPLKVDVFFVNDKLGAARALAQLEGDTPAALIRPLGYRQAHLLGSGEQTLTEGKPAEFKAAGRLQTTGIPFDVTVRVTQLSRREKMSKLAIALTGRVANPSAKTISEYHLTSMTEAQTNQPIIIAAPEKRTGTAIIAVLKATE